MDSAYENALADLRSFEQGGVDAVIIENNYDIPHVVKVNASVLVCMANLAEKIRKATRLPLGINVLWNDYEAALSLAKIYNYQFIRLPVFVDTVRTDCGLIRGNPRDVILFRERIKANKVALLTDIHVKHSTLISRYSLVQSARLARKNGSDGIIMTGRWTGVSPDVKELQSVRKAVGAFPIFVGSGTTARNIADLFQYVNGTIVSTSLKKGFSVPGETNVKRYRQRIDRRKVETLVKIVRQLKKV